MPENNTCYSSDCSSSDDDSVKCKGRRIIPTKMPSSSTSASSSDSESDYCNHYESSDFSCDEDIPHNVQEFSKGLKDFFEEAKCKGGTKYVEGGKLDADYGLPGLRIKMDNGELQTIGFPLTSASATELIQFCSKAPYGKGEETVYDENIRKTWQLDKSKFKITNPRWKDLIEVLVNTRVRDGLGINRTLILRPSLYKLLIYEEGGHFQFHKDSEKEDRMFGTLVVQLPSEYTGGEIVVRHGDKEETFDFSSVARYSPQFVSFYADCEHMVKHIKSGYRACLIYNLCFAGDVESKPTLTGYEELAQKLHKLVSQWKDFTPKNTNNLFRIYLFEHQYSQKSLSVDNLKGSDFNIYHTLKTYSEQYQDIAMNIGILERNVEGFEDPEVTLHYICGNDSKVDVKFSSIVSKSALALMRFHHKYINENTGNEGATKEKQYRNACLMIYPKKAQQSIYSKFGISFSLDNLSSFLKSNTREASIDFLKTLLGKGKHLSASEENILVQSIIDLDNAELANLFIRNFTSNGKFSALISHFTLDVIRESLCTSLLQTFSMSQFLRSLIEINDIPLITMAIPKYNDKSYSFNYECYDMLKKLAQKCTFSLSKSVLEKLEIQKSYRPKALELLSILKDTYSYEVLLELHFSKMRNPNSKTADLEIELITQAIENVGKETIVNKLQPFLSHYLNASNCVDILTRTLSHPVLFEFLIETSLNYTTLSNVEFSKSLINFLNNNSKGSFITKVCECIAKFAHHLEYVKFLAPLIDNLSKIMPKSDDLDLLLNKGMNIIELGIRNKDFAIPFNKFSIDNVNLPCACGNCTTFKRFLTSKTEASCQISGRIADIRHVKAMAVKISEIKQEDGKNMVTFTKIPVLEVTIKSAIELNNQAKSRLESLLKKRRTPPSQQEDKQPPPQTTITEPPNKKIKKDISDKEVICIDD